MLETITQIQAKCDYCNSKDIFGTKQDVFDNGWEELNNKLCCNDCVAKFNGLEFELEEHGYVTCLIDDVSRHLGEGEEYRITELIYLSSYSDEKAKKNLAIYVNVGNGWQARLDKGEYEIA